MCDEADNGIQLWYLTFEKNADIPQFKDCAKHPHIDDMGYVLFYTHQCPFNAKYVPILEETAAKNGIAFKAIQIKSREEAKNAPTPITTYALFYDGKYITNEQMNDKKLVYISIFYSTTIILVPLPSSLTNSIFPSCSSTICFTIARPRPVPPVSLDLLLSTR